MNRASALDLAGLVQSAMVECLPASVTFAGNATVFTVAAWKWRESSPLDSRGGGGFPMRTRAFRITKTLLSDAGITVAAEATRVVIDGVGAMVIDVDSGGFDTAFKITVEASAPAGRIS